MGGASALSNMVTLRCVGCSPVQGWTVRIEGRGLGVVILHVAISFTFTAPVPFAARGVRSFRPQNLFHCLECVHARKRMAYGVHHAWHGCGWAGHVWGL